MGTQNDHRLDALYQRFIEKLPEPFPSVDRSRRRGLKRLQDRGINTVGDLIQQLPSLPEGMQRVGIDLICIMRAPQAVPTLLAMAENRKIRLACADAASRLGRERVVTRHFLKIGRRELASDTPDPEWLLAAAFALGSSSSDPEATEVLAEIFVRTDLPGWLRGEAANKLGMHSLDRRLRLWKPLHAALLQGLEHDSIDVQFWSMYLIGVICSGSAVRIRMSRVTRQRDFGSVVPILKRIAARDQRLAPGYWWPMSAEAEDIIGCIESGSWPEPDASERWQGQERAPLTHPLI